MESCRTCSGSLFAKNARKSSWWSFVAAALLTSCGGDPSGPKGLAATYDLVSYNGAALPVEIRKIIQISPTTGQQVTCSDQLIAGQLETAAQNRFQETESTVIKCDDGSPDVSSSTIVQGTYALNGSNVVFTSDSFDYGGVPATMTMSAVLAGDGLTIIESVVRRTDGQTFSDYSQLLFSVHQ